MPTHKSLFGALFGWTANKEEAATTYKEIAPSMLNADHHHVKRYTEAEMWQHNHHMANSTKYSKKYWNPIQSIKKGIEEYSKWGQIQFIDSEGKPIETQMEKINKNSGKSSNLFKWYEEKTTKYLAYESAAKKFLPKADYESRGKCPIMSFLTSESQIDAYMNKPQDKESPFYVEEAREGNGIPTALFHGFGDFCLQPGDIQFASMLASGTGSVVKCIEVGVPMVGSIVNNFRNIAQKSCQKIANDEVFGGEFNVVGLSQGGLLARYIAEECDMPGKVRNIVTLGGPHMGVAAVPHCFDGIACDLINMAAKQLVYTEWAQNWIAPAGYFRDVNDMDAYEKQSVFLPKLNNEQKNAKAGKYAGMRKASFSEINAGLFGMFSNDTMIFPKETAWFQGLDRNERVMKLEDQDFYKYDYIGLKSLNEAGKITFSEIKGDHLQFTTEYVKETVIPFLKK